MMDNNVAKEEEEHQDWSQTIFPTVSFMDNLQSSGTGRKLGGNLQIQLTDRF